MRKKLLLIVILVGLLFPLIKVHAEGQVFINDRVGILNDSLKEEISNKMNTLTNYGTINFQTVKDNIDYNETVAKLDDMYKNSVSDENGIMILFNINDQSQFNIMAMKAYGSLDEKLGDAVITIVWEETPVLKEGNYKNAILDTLTSLDDYLSGRKVLELEKVEEAKQKLTTTTDNSILKDNKVVIDDDANLLTDEEKAKLMDVMSPLTEYGYIILKTANNVSDTTENEAHNYYYEHFGNSSGTMLFIDMSNRYIYICSAGDNYKIITKNKADIITDNIYQYASKGDYYGCSEEAFKEIGTLLSGGKIAEPMRIASNVVLSLVLGFLLTFWFIANSMKIKKASEAKRIDNSLKAVTIANVIANQTGQHKQYSPVESSSGGSGFSGGGSSGGGGGGGGFSGGGGGHSF